MNWQDLKSHLNMSAALVALSYAGTIASYVVGASNPVTLALIAASALAHAVYTISHANLGAAAVAAAAAQAAQAAADTLGAVTPPPAPAVPAPAPAPAAANNAIVSGGH